MSKRETKGVLVISNLEPGNTTFEHDHGVWNVTRAFADCVRGKHKLFRFHVTEALAGSAAIEHDPDKVAVYAHMPELERFKPIFVNLQDKLWLIDGIHHLRAMQQRGFITCEAYVIEEADNARYRVLFNGRYQSPLAKGKNK